MFEDHENGFWIDIGHGHFIHWTSYQPDRELNPHAAHLPDVEKFGLLVDHYAPDGRECAGGIYFDGPVHRELYPGKPGWTVESWEPLTVSPSLLCICGDHGFIREGRWVPA